MFSNHTYSVDPDNLAIVYLDNDTIFEGKAFEDYEPGNPCQEKRRNYNAYVEKLHGLFGIVHHFLVEMFGGDISMWDVSNVTNMYGMFAKSQFTGDIARWDVSNVKCMACMFDDASFNGVLALWDVSNVIDMTYMFASSSFNNDISGWDVSKVQSMYKMFNYSWFEQDISGWKINALCNCSQMFKGRSGKCQRKSDMPKVLFDYGYTFKDLTALN